MRILSITMFFVVFSLPALACKPKGLEECAVKDLNVDQKSFAQLLKKVKTYQGQMDQVIRYPEKRTSCFNNHFANFYGDQFLTELNKNNGKTCEKNLSQVESAFWSLATDKSLEYKSISPKAQDHFKDELDSLQDSLKKFFSGVKRK